MSKEYSGSLGFVVLPDPETKKVLEELSLLYSREGDILPDPYHLSLYHGHFRNIPEELTKQLLQQISFLLGSEYSLDTIQPYGGKFLFWNVKKAYPQLQQAHESTIEKLSPFIDREKIGLALKEKLKMTQPERNNLEKYSYPLVKELFMPHYTLLYRESGVDISGNKNQRAKIKNIQFVQIAGYSRVKNVILSS